MNAQELFGITRNALSIAETPSWPSPLDSTRREALTYFPEGIEEKKPEWALAPADADATNRETVLEDAVALETNLAAELIKAHLRTWLLRRGWQVQVRLRGGTESWRLADVLAIGDGGGDRLQPDEVYPHGEDELAVLCDSIPVVARNHPANRNVKGSP